MKMNNKLTDIQTGIVQTIIEWARMARTSTHIEYADNGTTFSIPTKAFNITPHISTNMFMKDFFDILIQKKCISSWGTNPYVSDRSAVFIFYKVNLERLEMLIDQNSHPQLLVNEVKAKVKDIQSMDILGPLEIQFLKYLLDLKPHSLKKLRKYSKAPHKMKEAINGKIKKFDLSIASIREDRKAFYQLHSSPLQK